MDKLPTPEDVCLGFTEKTDFSIFLKYPDIEFDPEFEEMDEPGPTIRFSSPAMNVVDDGPGPAVHFSSPTSDSHHHHDDTDFASRSNSTPHTTPSRLDAFEESVAAPDEYQQYASKLKAMDLPETTIHYYRSLADQILLVAVHLQPKILYVSVSETTTQGILHDSGSLLSQLKQSAKVVSEQIAATNHITSLAPFTIIPTDLALYPIYTQRASLIIKHLSLPSFKEQVLLSDLLPLFDAYIYSPYLHLPGHHFASLCAQRINSLYDALNTLNNLYNTWLRTVHHLKQTYMTPILRRIHDSSWVRTEIKQMEHALEACSRMNSKPISEVAGGCDVGEEQVEGAEKLAAQRRTKSSIAVKDRRRMMVRAQTRTRVRREHNL